MKLLTEILKPEGMIKKKFRVEGSKIILKRGSKGRGHADETASFDQDSIIHYKTNLFKMPKQKLMLIDGADRCISIKYSAKDAKIKDAKVELPVWDKYAEQRAFDANVVKNSGAISQKIQIPAMFYLVGFMGIAISFLTLMVASGRMKL